MNARHQRIELENLLIFRGRFVPFSLCFQRLRVQFMNLVGKRRLAHQFVRSVNGKVGKSVRRSVEDLWIVGKVTAQHVEKLQGVVRSLMGQGATDAVESDPLLE